ncbi:6,7-dimethyl-8-ribityllumazine synthase [Candidatus Dependentiae bacterium]|nr:6,7-dimethyl-8-ribityllumazine synthase [Candidatus Dependentiae bacterium]
MVEISGKFVGKGKKFCIVISRFNELITRKLLEGAIDCFQRHSVNGNDIDIYWVPGSFEIPSAIQKILKSKKKNKSYNGIIALGAVIRGDTPHFDYVAAEVSKGIASMSIESTIPVIYGVLTTDTIEQAMERAGTKAGNRGFNAALSVLEMSDLYGKI